MKITNHTQKLTTISAVGLVSKPNDGTLIGYVQEIEAALQKHGVKLLIEEQSAQALGCVGVSFEQMCAQSDFLISLGGDGAKKPHLSHF